MEELTSEECADLLYCLKLRKESLQNKIHFYLEVVGVGRNNSTKLEPLRCSVLGFQKEIDSITLLENKILKYL